MEMLHQWHNRWRSAWSMTSTARPPRKPCSSISTTAAPTRLTSTARTLHGSETPSPPSLPPLVELADGLSDQRPHDKPRAGPGKRHKQFVSGFGPTAGRCPTADASAVTSSARTRIRPPRRRRRPRRKPLRQRRARSRRPPRDPTRSSFKPHPRDDHVARARVRVLAFPSVTFR